MGIGRFGGRLVVSAVPVYEVAMLGASRMFDEDQVPAARSLEHEHQ
jgi:hypothetical protein